MIRSTLFLLSLFAALLSPGGANGQRLARLARPDANMMVGIRMAEFASSPLGQRMWQEALSSQPGIEQIMSLAGPNPLNLIDEILITANITEASEIDKADSLVLARGRFNEAQLVDLLCQKGCETETYGGLRIREGLGRNDGPSHFAMLETGELVLGSRELVQGAIERRSSGAPASFSGAMTDWINRLGSHHIWVAASGPFPQAPSGAGGQMMLNLTSKLDGFGLGVNVSSGIEMSLDLQTTTEQDARQFHDMIQGFITMAKANESQPEKKEFLDKLRLSLDGRVLAARMSISQADIEWQLAQQGQQDQTVSSGSSQAERRPASPPPPPPEPKRRSGGIRIYGLGDEPLEVPTQQP